MASPLASSIAGCQAARTLSGEVHLGPSLDKQRAIDSILDHVVEAVTQNQFVVLDPILRIRQIPDLLVPGVRLEGEALDSGEAQRSRDLPEAIGDRERPTSGSST